MTDLDRARPNANRRAAQWWRHAAIYQVYVRSFADTTGDGVGDLAGVREHLRYIAGLGVDALWLTPFYASPMADGGYDVADYRAVDPMFGDLAGAEALIADAHRLGLRIMVDIVPNHTSDAHAWFRAALAGGPGCDARRRYHFGSGRGTAGELPPNDWKSMFGGSAWSRVTEPDGDPGEWYLHLFAPEQPDLNWDDPRVRDEFDAILAFWLDRGVDGFRIDVAHGLVKQAGLPDVGDAATGALDGGPVPYYDQDGVHEIYRRWRSILDSYPGERIAVGEAWVLDAERLAAYVRPDELHQVFNFGYLETPWSAGRLRAVIDDSLATTSSVGAPATWVLSNHDVVRHVTRFGGGETGLRRARAATLLALALPGSTYLYQGEELGLPEVTDLPDEALRDPIWERTGHTIRGRDGCRVPMPWGGDAPPFGFAADGSAAWLPQPASWRELTVQAQQADPSSTLALYRAALRRRAARAELGDGRLRWLDAPADVLAFARDPGTVCATNLGDAPADLPGKWQVLLSSSPVEPAPAAVTIPPDTTCWLESATPLETAP